MNAGKQEAKNIGLGLIPARPALPLAVLFIIGVIAHDHVSISSDRLIVIASGLLLVAVFLHRLARFCSIMLALTVVVLAIAIANLQHFHYSSDHISAFAMETPRLAQLELKIDQPPRILSGFGQFRALPPKQVCTAQVLKVKGWNGWIESAGGILVQIDQPHPRLDQGQIIRVLGMLQRPSPAMNPGQFDWASYYRAQGILASVNIPNAGNIQVIEQHFEGPLNWLRDKSRRLLAMGFTMDQSLDHALLRALLLGDNDPELRDVQEQFRRTGTSHHLSISGLHVAVLGGFIYLLCRLLQIRPRLTVWITTIFIAIYGIVAMPSPPVIRSVLLCIGVGIGILNRRSVDYLNLMAICAFGMLCWKPLDLYNAGFQLSFGTVLGMILFTPPVRKWFENVDEQIIAQQHNFRAWVMRRRLWMRMILVNGAVAWLVSLPMIAFHFEQLNPWAIPAGIVLGPVVFFSLIFGLLKIVLTMVYPGFAAWWVVGATAPIRFMQWILSQLAKLPGSDIPLPAPAISTIIIFYILLTLPFIPWTRWRWEKWSRLAPALGILLILVIPLRASWAQYTAATRELRVTLLAVGAGQCCVIEPPGAPATLVDVGSASLGGDLLRKCVGPFLRHEGRREIGKIMLTHGDFDHISAAFESAIAFDVKEILTSPHFRRHAFESPPAENLIESLDKLDFSPRQVSRNDRIDLGGGAKLSVLWPTNDTNFNSNNCGLVMKLTFAGKSILLPADIQDPAIKELLKNPDQLKSDVLIAPHHGSSESTTADFVSAIDPQIIASSNDRTLTQKQLRFEKLIGDRTLYRTNRVGAITIVIRSDGQLWVETHLKSR